MLWQKALWHELLCGSRKIPFESSSTIQSKAQMQIPAWHLYRRALAEPVAELCLSIRHAEHITCTSPACPTCKGNFWTLELQLGHTLEVQESIPWLPGDCTEGRGIQGPPTEPSGIQMCCHSHQSGWSTGQHCHGDTAMWQSPMSHRQARGRVWGSDRSWQRAKVPWPLTVMLTHENKSRQQTTGKLKHVRLGKVAIPSRSGPAVSGQQCPSEEQGQ